MTAYSQISNLIYRYAELIDQGDFAGIGQLFSRAKLINGSNHTEGSENITQLYKNSTRLYECGTPKTQHQVSNIQFQHTNDTIKTRSYFSVSQATNKLPLQTIIAGSYHDVFCLDEHQQWFFSEREIQISLIGNLDHHLLFQLGSTND